MNGSLRSARPESPAQSLAMACSIIECLGAHSVGALTWRPARTSKEGGGEGSMGVSSSMLRNGANGATTPAGGGGAAAARAG
eukprot:4266541-Prymnesium_polylepis.1